MSGIQSGAGGAGRKLSGRDKVSSLRLRIERVRATFDKSMNVVKLGFGLMVVILAAIGLYVTF